MAASKYAVVRFKIVSLVLSREAMIETRASSFLSNHSLTSLMITFFWFAHFLLLLFVDFFKIKCCCLGRCGKDGNKLKKMKNKIKNEKLTLKVSLKNFQAIRTYF